tara:strand:- start:202 stop:369 length:168 start_codon:yes stop_codon:yes gene_type:complete
MKVGDLVKHCMFSNYGIGTIVEVRTEKGTTSYKVQWAGHTLSVWYDDDKLEAACK